jgi:hypothetical protein
VADVIVVALPVAFFALAVLVVRACDLVVGSGFDGDGES